MKSIVSFIGGVIFTLLVLAGVGYFAVKAGIVPANADSKPTALESWVANTALDAALERDTKGLKNCQHLRARRKSKLDPYKPIIQRWLEQHPFRVTHNRSSSKATLR